MNKLVRKTVNGIHQRWVHYRSNQRWKLITRKVFKDTPINGDERPVVFFNATTRLQAVSQNAAYSLIAALGVRLQGVPVLQFVCNAGLSRCMLGSNKDDFNQQPPCAKCIRQSREIFSNIPTTWFDYQEDKAVSRQIANLTVPEMGGFEYQGIPLGTWSINSLRWVLRRHHLQDDELTRNFMRAFILSAWNVYCQFKALITKEHPRAVVVFNGISYPEAAVKHACREAGIKVVTHEVGLRPFSAFFTTGEATAYPMKITEDFQLTPEMNKTLDEYLSNRFKGNFSMAGIRFWPEMNGLDENLLTKLNQYKKVVPVFTNVIFDTSQVHANTLFEHMFDWLENIRCAAMEHPEILFIIRAHPDETRAGKQSRESVADWVKTSGAIELPNVIFIKSDEFISSYELVQRAHLVMVYNSTIGLEASLMGKPVLAGGKARFTQLVTSFFPKSKAEYIKTLNDFLKADEIRVPAEFQTNARRFLYYQLYVTSLQFGDFLEEDRVWQGYVKPKAFPVDKLRPESSATMKALVDGILDEGSFYYPL